MVHLGIDKSRGYTPYAEGGGLEKKETLPLMIYQIKVIHRYSQVFHNHTNEWNLKEGAYLDEILNSEKNRGLLSDSKYIYF